MYALSRGPSKIVASTRRGPTKSLDNLEKKDPEKEQSRDFTMSSPKPVFNHSQNHVNGRRGLPRSNSSGMQESACPQHEELIKYLNDSWIKVNNELEQSAKHQREGGPIIYKDKTPHNAILQNFKPFDLESYWGERQLHKLNIQS